jgi:hypothetical protein
MKRVIVLLMILLAPSVYADTIMDQSLITPLLTDQVWMVDDPGGTPGDGRATVQSLADIIIGDLVAGDIPDISATYLTLAQIGTAYDTEAELDALFAAKLSAATIGAAYDTEAELDALFAAKEDTLTNEAGLYSALSDVSDFFQPTDDLTGTDGQLIDLSAITHTNDTNEGLILPTWANVTVVGLTSGALAWDETTDALKVKSDAGWQSIGATAAPTDAQYLTLDADATLSVERVLTAGAGIDFTDGGAGSTLTIDGETGTVTNPGILELATNAEAITGTDTARAVTPDGVLAVLEGGTFNLSGSTITFGLEDGDIPAAITRDSEAAAAYEPIDSAITKTDEAETITANWVNTANPWADNEVADTLTVDNSSTVDPDAMAGDTTDDDLIDQDVIEGFAGLSDPYMGFRDSDAAGADEADEEAGRIYANLVTATEDAEDSDMWFTIMQAGSRVEVLRFDESDDQWETTKNIVVPTEAYDATNWNGDLTVPTKDAVRDKIEGLAGTGTMTTVEDGDSGVGGADIVTLDFDGTVFNITESPDTEINIDIADDGLDSQHYAGASVDPEHISSGAWDFGTSVEADTITEGGVGVINTGETEVIDSDMYVDASIDPAHVASGAWDFGTSVEADTLTEGGNAVWNDADTDVVDDTHLNWASMTYLGEEGQPTAAAVGLASDNLDDTDASIEWEDAADLESDGAISDNAVDYSATAGSVKALPPVVDAAADFAANFTGANLYGGTFVCDTTGTIQLPAVAAGMNFTIITKGAIAVVVEPNASDMMMLDGTDLDDADSATNLSTAGDIIVFQYMSAAGWIATSNGWTDED